MTYQLDNWSDLWGSGGPDTAFEHVSVCVCVKCMLVLVCFARAEFSYLES